MRQSKLNAKLKEVVKTNPSVTKKKIHPDAAHLVKSSPRMEGARPTPRAPIAVNYDGVVPETRFANHRPKNGKKPASAKRSWQ